MADLSVCRKAEFMADLSVCRKAEAAKQSKRGGREWLVVGPAPLLRHPA